jgi:hypothetical protein
VGVFHIKGVLEGRWDFEGTLVGTSADGVNTITTCCLEVPPVGQLDPEVASGTEEQQHNQLFQLLLTTITVYGKTSLASSVKLASKNMLKALALPKMGQILKALALPKMGQIRME